ncbi:MAG: HAD family hydrolase [Oscillibacter sp.]|nr:HAD family hydrolase [Oscillibacter sp.]
MHRRLIFLDIDGTLTEPGSNTPPASAQEAIRRARAAGHQVFLCSGRNYGMLSPLLPYGFDGVISSAGGCIQYGGQRIYDCPMTPEQQEKALSVLEEHGVFRTAESFSRSYADPGFKKFLLEKAGKNSEFLRWREQLEQDLGIRSMSEYQGEPIYKIVFMAPHAASLQGPRKALEDAFQFCLQEPDALGIIHGELINRKFNKGAAIERLCRYLQVPLADTVAFGDSMNDLEMIQTAGLGVAMGNACQSLRKAARAVCPPVQKDGLYRAFAQYGFLD